MGRTFLKYEGLGNDFVVVESDDEASVSSDAARAICDRRRGVGADGVLLVLPSRVPGAIARMKVVNADGSVPEMCGNGLRCVALHLVRAKSAPRAFAVDTDAGPRACEVDDAGGMVTVDMGLVKVGGARTLDVGGEPIELWTADAGNPHAVIFGDASRARAERIGPRIETHASFPGRTNVECARIEGGAIELVVWERGVGITLACGTGACATVAVACARGAWKNGEPARVRLPGGELEVTIDAAGRATMRGPARFVFSGQLAA